MIESGELDQLIRDYAIHGMTSNPTIFHQAMVKSDDYKSAIEKLAHSGMTTSGIYESLAVEDIQSAADNLRFIYDSSKGRDGYISLEVSPELANDTDATIQEARRLWKKVNRPNLMIKVPGTREGIPAIEQLLISGINVNITLLFSLEDYEVVRHTYIGALENRLENGKPIDHLASVASFFLSRIDTLIDDLLEENERADNSEAKALKGKAAIASAKIAYQHYLNDFHSERFMRLKTKGGKVQRPLWASTSTKNPNYSDVIYVEPLIGQDVINTLPLPTVKAFNDHGVARDTIGIDLNESYKVVERLEEIGISMRKVTSQLQDEGVQKFKNSFRELMTGLEAKRKQLIRY